MTGMLFRPDHNYPIFQFNEQMLKAVDPQSFSAYAHAHGRTVSEGHPSLQGKIQSADSRAGEHLLQNGPALKPPER